MKFSNWNKLLNGDTSVLKQEQKTNKITEDKIYRLKWAGGHRTSLVNHNQAIRQVNEQFNRQGWKWIRIINENTKAVQIITEPGPSVNRGVLQLRKLNENMLVETKPSKGTLISESYEFEGLDNKDDFDTISDELSKKIVMKKDNILNWLNKNYKNVKEFNNVMKKQKGKREPAVFDYIKYSIMNHKKIQ